MWKSRQWFLNGDGWQQLVSCTQMGRALVTGIQEGAGHRWSEWKRDGSVRKQFDELNLRWMRVALLRDSLSSCGDSKWYLLLSFSKNTEICARTSDSMHVQAWQLPDHQLQIQDWDRHPSAAASAF
ncbi:hypothetical protein PAMP_020007 [Pampus punctatissimus]